jgi:hypothetical protein
MVHEVSLKITVRNNVPSENILAETLIPEVIYSESRGNHSF